MNVHDCGVEMESQMAEIEMGQGLFESVYRVIDSVPKTMEGEMNSNRKRSITDKHLK